ncbi:MAG: hypothetical protein WBP16_00570 [Ferruginibacter sp.]
MKTIKNYFFIFLLGFVFYSCQKEISSENIVTTQSAGSLAKDTSGNCLPVTVNGIYKKDSLLNATHYIDVSVNVTAIGNYLIKTDTTNGIYFKDSAAFAATGLQTVRLKGYGKPLAAGTTSLTIQYNGSSSCAVQLMVTTAGSSAASFTLAGAPGSCTSPIILGTYTAGTALNASNKIQLNVIVTATGDYTLSTTTVNGISFSATGTFTSATPQTVTLSATGTPVAVIPTTLAVTGAPAGCSFTIVVDPVVTSGTKLKRIIQSYVGSRQAIITSLTYDASGRLLTFNEWEEDSSFTPVKITHANYSAFTYNGAAEYPIKNTVSHVSVNIDSTLYTYDSQNRVIKEENIYNGQVNLRNIYTYLSPTVVLFGKYVRSAGVLAFQGNDSLIFDSQKRIIEKRDYDFANVYSGYFTCQYDNKNNPFALIKMFDHIFTLYCDDAKFFYRSPNNLAGYSQVTLPSYLENLSVTYTSYNAANYPLTSTASVTSGSPGSTQNFTLTYEYY